MLAVLRKLNVLSEDSVQKIKKFGFNEVRNWAGTLVGKIEIGDGLSF